MATSTTEDAAAAGVAVPPSSLEEYKEAVADHAAAASMGTTADATDATVGWTVQSDASIPDPVQVPGQVYHPSQLPDPSVARRAGFPPVPVPEHLVVDEEDHPQGPEPWETGSDPRDVRDAIRDRVIKEHKKATGAPAPAKKLTHAAPAANKS